MDNDYLPSQVEPQKNGIPLEGIKGVPLALFYAINTHLPGALPRVYGNNNNGENDVVLDDLFHKPTKMAPDVKLNNGHSKAMKDHSYASLLAGVESCACERDETKKLTR